MFYPCISFLEGYIIHRMKRKTPTRYGRMIKNLRVEFHNRFAVRESPRKRTQFRYGTTLFLKHPFRNFPGRDQHICRTANAVGKHTQSAYPPKFTSCQRIFCSAFLFGVFRFWRNSGGRDRHKRAFACSFFLRFLNIGFRKRRRNSAYCTRAEIMRRRS